MGDDLRFIRAIWTGFLSVLAEVMTLTMWASWAVTSLVVALAGPFGTFATQPFQWRLLYWGGVIASGIVLSLSLRTIWRSVLRGRADWQEDLAVAVSLAVVFGPIVVCLNWQLGGDTACDAMGIGLTTIYVFAIAVSIIAVRRSLEARLALPTTIRRDRLLNRISAPKTARLARISSDNHHIRITMQGGAEHRLLMRLSDAVQEVDVEPGVFVHRSHWVARSSIAGVVRDGPRELVELTCGSQVPVGAKYRANLINAGVITD